MTHKASLACAGAFAAATLFASSATAADLAPAAPPPPPFTWTGIYLGGQIGGAWGNNAIYYPAYDPISGNNYNPSVTSTPSGVIGGAHVGFNYEIVEPGSSFVIGIEGSVDGTSLKRTTTASVFDFGGAFGGTSVTASENANIQGSIRGRFGVAWDRLLTYATGGVAFGGVNANYSVIGNTTGLAAINGGAPFYGSNSYSNSRVGWTAGGGLSYAITDNWSVFAEYRYTSFGTVSNVGLAGGAFTPTSGLAGGSLYATRALNENQAQAGFSYKFDTHLPAPDFSMF